MCGPSAITLHHAAIALQCIAIAAFCPRSSANSVTRSCVRNTPSDSDFIPTHLDWSTVLWSMLNKQIMTATKRSSSTPQNVSGHSGVPKIRRVHLGWSRQNFDSCTAIWKDVPPCFPGMSATATVYSVMHFYVWGKNCTTTWHCSLQTSEVNLLAGRNGIVLKLVSFFLWYGLVNQPAGKQAGATGILVRPLSLRVMMVI